MSIVESPATARSSMWLRVDDCPSCRAKLVLVEEGDSGAPKQETLVLDREKRLARWDQVFAATPWKLATGSTFAGRYKIVNELGRGGMATVYLALDTVLDRRVALKIPKLTSADDSLLKRFQREARVGAQLGHSNICQVIEVNQFDGVPYLTMEFIKGVSLSDLLKQRGGTLPEQEAVRLAHTLAKALGEAHGKGIIHRDLKPSNIMIREDGTPVVMDFGLARREDDEHMTTGVIGTPEYMSPEQATGENRTIGPATDVYSLGVILYELLTGRTPFRPSEARNALKGFEVQKDPQANRDRRSGALLGPSTRSQSRARFDLSESDGKGAVRPFCRHDEFRREFRPFPEGR